MGYNFECGLFTGYKPCRYKRSCDLCELYQRVDTRIAIISLEALGAVLRSTVLLQPLRRKFGACHITWITYPNAKSLLQNNPLIDRIVTVEASTIALLHHLKFDYLFAVDKSLESGALAETLGATHKFGFGLTSKGVIRPLSVEAEYQYAVGLDDQLKFFTNQKPETQQITETMGLKWERDEYVLALSKEESENVRVRRAAMLHDGGRGIIGYNTGCSTLYPYKKFTVERSIELIAQWRKHFPDHFVALLGGREDAERQRAMKLAFADDERVINTPTDEGLRSGILWMDASDIVFTGCSLGLHIGVALKKKMIAWFGVSCAHEIDLYDRGFKLIGEVSCTPCWRKQCDNNPKCYDKVDIDKIVMSTQDLLAQTV